MKDTHFTGKINTLRRKTEELMSYGVNLLCMIYLKDMVYKVAEKIALATQNTADNNCINEESED